MIQCTNSNCKFKHECMTFLQTESCKVNLPTPDFKDECQYYYNIEKEEESKVVTHHVCNKNKQLSQMILGN